MKIFIPAAIVFVLTIVAVLMGPPKFIEEFAFVFYILGIPSSLVMLLYALRTCWYMSIARRSREAIAEMRANKAS